MNSNVKNFFRNIIATSMIISFTLVQFSFAQVASSTPSAPDSTPVTTGVIANVDVSATPNPDTQASSTTPLVQDTSNTQPTILGTALESTTNPQDAGAIPPVDATSSTTTPDVTSDSTTTPLVFAIDSTTTLEVIGQAIDPAVPVVDPNVPHSIEPSTPTPVVLPLKELAPKPEYAFAIVGTSIPSKRNVAKPDGTLIQEPTIPAVLTPTVDNETGVVKVSGACTNVYYVVLLFKNPGDYIDEPASYIVNRAYPCVGGTYSYSISDLPYNLGNGTYYLLVGEQGNKGGWAPITDIMPITINRNQ